MALICDTGALLAALDKDDPQHRPCADLIAGSDEDLVVPTLVLAELDYWCGKLKLRKSWVAFLEDLEAGVWRLEHPSAADLVRCRDLQVTYGDMPIGLVDASVLALTERLLEPKLATLDRRHFSTLRPRHIAALTLLPG